MHRFAGAQRAEDPDQPFARKHKHKAIKREGKCQRPRNLRYVVISVALRHCRRYEGVLRQDPHSLMHTPYPTLSLRVLRGLTASGWRA